MFVNKGFRAKPIHTHKEIRKNERSIRWASGPCVLDPMLFTVRSFKDSPRAIRATPWGQFGTDTPAQKPRQSPVEVAPRPTSTQESDPKSRCFFAHVLAPKMVPKVSQKGAPGELLCILFPCSFSCRFLPCFWEVFCSL